MRADAVDAHRLGAGHLAHHVDIVDAAIDDRRQRLHQVLVPGPGVADRLLVQVHAHDERLAQTLRELDKLHPGGMDTQDVADDELLVGVARRGDDAFCVLHRLGDRLFHEDVRARLEGADGVVGMRVGPGVDRDDIGLQRLERLVIVRKARHVRPACRQVGALGDAPGAEPGEFEPLDLVVGAGVRSPHIADANDQHAQWAVLLRFSVRLRGHVFPPLSL